MNCPKCNAAMNAVNSSGETVDACSACGGLWFDLREHETIAAAGDAARLDAGDPSRGRQQNEKRDISCPNCKVKMLKMAVPGQAHIQYESCPVCHGAFFDAGEFKDFASLSIGERIGQFFRGFRKK